MYLFNHTVYVLHCFDEYIKLSGNKNFAINFKKGIDFYINNFFENDGKPKYFNNKTYPVDSTSAAQSIITLTRIGRKDLAEKVLLWFIYNMQSNKGYFYYQKHKFYTNKISYIRWSNAYILLALSYYLSI